MFSRRWPNFRNCWPGSSEADLPKPPGLAQLINNSRNNSDNGAPLRAHVVDRKNSIFASQNNMKFPDDAIWVRCAKALGHPEWCQDPRFATNR
jgi:hypothetical protein